MSRPPTPEQCLKILAGHRVPPHIRRHSEQVARVARRLAEALVERAGEALDVDQIVAASLLHDIAKADCLESRRDHAREGGEVLRELGLPAIAALVERHVELGAWERGGPVTEAEILNYSDKRVRHEAVVTLDERFRDLLERYGRFGPTAEVRIRENWRITTTLEAKIFARLGAGPDPLTEQGAE